MRTARRFHGASARLDMLDPDRRDAWTVEHVQLTVLDERRPVRAIPGDHILSVNEESVGYTVTVDASEKKDPGDTLTTRGA
jgi:hypothetical protein